MKSNGNFKEYEDRIVEIIEGEVKKQNNGENPYSEVEIKLNLGIGKTLKLSLINVRYTDTRRILAVYDWHFGLSYCVGYIGEAFEEPALSNLICENGADILEALREKISKMNLDTKKLGCPEKISKILGEDEKKWKD